MAFKITASITSEFTAKYEVDSKDEALKMFRVIYPEADVIHIESVESCTHERVPEAGAT